MKRISFMLVFLLLMSVLGNIYAQQKNLSAKSTDVGIKLSSADYLAVDGSTLYIPLAKAIASKLLGITQEKANQITVFNTTHPAYLNLIYRQKDLILVTPPSAEELALAKKQKVELEITSIGKEAFVFLTNVRNPVSSLSHEQIIDIYTGKITQWSQVGGKDLPIKAFQRPANSGSQTVMLNLVMKDKPLLSPPKFVEDDMAGLVDVIAEYDNGPNSLGYSFYFYVTTMYANANVKLLAINNVPPNPQTIKAGSYPFIQECLVIIRKDAPKGSPERRLRDWLLTAEGQKVVKESGFIPIKG